MRYTQGQIRDLIGLSVESLRAWRNVVPFIEARKGHGQTFTAGDLISFAALAELVGPFGVRIGAVAEQAQELFELCHEQPWLALDDCVIEIDQNGARLVRASEIRATLPPAVWKISCRFLIARLRATLSTTDASQGFLQFAPVAVGDRA